MKLSKFNHLLKYNKYLGKTLFNNGNITKYVSYNEKILRYTHTNSISENKAINKKKEKILYDYKLTYDSVTGADIIYQRLKHNGVKDVFLYSGGSIMPLVDKFYKGDINYYINSHEQNSGHAATGYAKSSNKTGVVITTSGPGITNLITPILDANNDSTPLIVLTGQVSRKNMNTDAFQEAPATEITKPITKFSYCLKSVEEISDVMDLAFKIANDGKKGAVHIDIPTCISTGLLTDELNYSSLTFHNYKKDEQNKFRIKEFDTDISYIANIINKSKRPIFYIGQGAKHCVDQLYKCVSVNRIPVTSTIHGKGIFPEDNPLSLKWCGMHGMPAANYSIQQSDCVIALGSRFDDRTTGNVDLYAPDATKNKTIIHVDIDGNQFHKSVKSNYNLKMDSKYFLNQLNNYIGINSRKHWVETINKLKDKNDFKYRIPDNGKLNTPLVIKSINDYLINNKIGNYHITTGVGNHQMMTYQFIDGLYPGRIHSSGSLGVMGAGLPYAVGVQIANPGSLVIDIDGDSSFLMTMSDMKTIVENNLPIKIAIMNDNKQMMVNIWEKLFFEERYTATINKRNPDFCMLGESFGLRSFKCSNQNELPSIINQFLSYNGPAICDFTVGEEICLPLVKPGKALDDMIMFDDYYNNDF